MIKIATPLTQVLDGQGEPTGHWALSGEVDRLVFHATVPDAYSDIVGAQTYLENREAKIKAKAELEASKAPRVKYLTSEALPQSDHIAQLKSVNIVARTAVVTRRFGGELYDVLDCEPTDYMFIEYLAGRLSIGDKVMVSFVHEVPMDTEITIPVIWAKRSN